MSTDEQLILNEYTPSHEGMMESWRDRFSKEEHVEIDGILKGLFEKDREHFEFVVWRTIFNVTIYMLFLTQIMDRRYAMYKQPFC